MLPIPKSATIRPQGVYQGFTRLLVFYGGITPLTYRAAMAHRDSRLRVPAKIQLDALAFDRGPASIRELLRFDLEIVGSSRNLVGGVDFCYEFDF